MDLIPTFSNKYSNFNVNDFTISKIVNSDKIFKIKFSLLSAFLSYQSWLYNSAFIGKKQTVLIYNNKKYIFTIKDASIDENNEFVFFISTDEMVTLKKNDNLARAFIKNKNFNLKYHDISKYETKFTLQTLNDIKGGFDTMRNLGSCITVFGSSRLKANNIYYQNAREFGNRIAQKGFTTVNGGAYGMMEASALGAFENGGKSVGVNVVINDKVDYNQYLTHKITFQEFFTRKVFLRMYSYAFIIMPGGVGTMDEFFELITLIQCNKTFRFPVVLFGTTFYQHLYNLLNSMAVQGTISASDLNLFLFTDDINQAMNHIEQSLITSI